MAGQYFDTETGLHYNYHRYYDPQTGRYITPDPIGLSGGINLFAYTINNPINKIDPYGLWDIALTPIAVGAAPAIAMADSPLLPFGDALAGALIGIALLHDKIEDGIHLPDDESSGSCPNGDDDDPRDGGIREGKPDVPEGSKQVGETVTRKANSPAFRDYLNRHNISKKGWQYKMQKYRTPDGRIIKRHWWQQKKTGMRFHHLR